jgi:hypothetical protein
MRRSRSRRPQISQAIGATDGGWEPEGTATVGEADQNAEFPMGEVPEDFEVDREAAFAAVQAAAEAAASAEVATDAANRADLW